MQSAVNIYRLQQIQRLLMTLIVGEGTYLLERSEEDDDIEVLLVMANLMVEEMADTLRYVGYLDSPEAIKEYVHMLFVLDTGFQVRYVNNTVHTLLGQESDALLGASFSDLLTADSLSGWQLIARDLLYKDNYHGTHDLSIKVLGELTKRCTFAFSTVSIAEWPVSFILVTTFETSLSSLFIENRIKALLGSGDLRSRAKANPPFKLSNEKDVRIIQSVRDCILQNISQPLPGLRVLAHEFGTNEHKLKNGFKQLYGTSVYRFLTQERLKRASMLLQNTSLPVKGIAQMIGFKNMSHFSKAFKKQYGVAPMALRK
ncbi:helix-turn-helix domain-containing protein [Gelidibacter mesophilus]|uniref:helix-turn-helix domain-containing protein n=1 Tax=Gelidibacter mesophilus TaxID=169050 RepID=UPI0003FEED8D|nr:helix-turn-helix domain-containing protein [Gelidibacter mesophilus]